MNDPVAANNALWCLATLVYIKVIVTSCDFLMNQKMVPADVSRKIIHFAACSWCLFWPQFDVAIPAAYTVQLIVKGAILRDPTDKDVKTMSRSGNPSELLYGPLLFTLVMLFCGLRHFLKPCGTYIMGALVGDGLAPLIGSRFPVLPYRTFGGDKKTVSGSIGMFAGSVVGILTYAHFLKVPQTPDLETVMMISLIATIAEAVSGIWDNPGIAFSVYWFVQATDIQIQI